MSSTNTGGLDVDDDAVFELVSKDGAVFPVASSVAVQSGLIRALREQDSVQTRFVMSVLSGRVLSKTVDFLHMHVHTPMAAVEKPIVSDVLSEVVGSTEYAQFVDVDRDFVFELVLAANYMQIEPFLELVCAKLATMIKGKSPDQLRAAFDIPDEFTEDEVTAINNENRWAEEDARAERA